MSEDIPKPVFVFLDNSSYTTSIDVAKPSWSSKTRENNECVLVCGAQDGSVNLWSLSTFQSLRFYDREEVARAGHISKHQDELLRVNSIFAIPSSTNTTRLFCQQKSSAVCLFDLDANDWTTKLARKWTSWEHTFAKCFHVIDNCVAFLSSTESGMIQLVSTEHCVNVCQLKLERMEEIDKKEDHGVVMAIHLFHLDIIPLPGIPTQNEKQALFVLVAYEDGLISLHRASLRERLETMCEHTIKDSGRYYEAMQMSTLQSHPEMVTCMDFNLTTMRGVSCSVDNEIVLWDVNLPEMVLKPDNSIDENRAQFTKLVTENKLGMVLRKRIPVTNASILCCAIRPDGRIFATGGKDGRIRLFGLKSGKPLVILPFHTNSIECVRFSHNLASDESQKKKYLLAASSRDKSISIWSLYNDVQ